MRSLAPCAGSSRFPEVHLSDLSVIAFCSTAVSVPKKSRSSSYSTHRQSEICMNVYIHACKRSSEHVSAATAACYIGCFHLS